MHLIEVIPCGPLAARFPSLKIGADSAADAIEGWSRQLDKAAARIVLSVVDFATEDALKAPTKVTKLYLYPAMFGGSAIGRILIGVVFIAASFIPGLGQAFQAALIASGIGMIVGGIVSLFMKAPSISKENDPEASKYIGTGRNTTAIGTPIPIGGGLMMIGGHYLSVQVNSNEFIIGKFPTNPT